MKIIHVIYLTWLILSAIRIVLSLQISSEGSDEFDESRVSISQDGVNSHNLKIIGDPPQKGVAVGKPQQQAVDNIAKTVEPLAPKIRGQDSTTGEIAIRKSSQTHLPDVRPKGNPSAQQTPARQTPDSKQSLTLSSRQESMVQNDQVALEICHPMKLSDFKRVSLTTGEMVIRDVEGRPCYTLTISGFIQWNDDSLYPLKNFKVYSTTVFHETDGSTKLARALNCSVASECGTGSDPTGLPVGPPIASPQTLYLHRLFREEIIVLVDCGYLVLRTRVFGPYFSLQSISFYRTTPPTVSLKPLSRSSRRFVKIVSQMQPQDLIFSTDGTRNQPLFYSPLVFIYTCSNRIELSGKNNVKLVLERFEIQRSAYLIPESRGSARPSSGASDGLGQQESGSHESMEPHKSLLSVVTRCPKPRPPNFSLSSMQDDGDKIRKEISARLTARMDIPLPNGAARWTRGLEFNLMGFRLSCYSYILTLCLLQHAFRKALSY